MADQQIPECDQRKRRTRPGGHAITVSRSFTGRQGLVSPVRRRAGLSAEGTSTVTLSVELQFADADMDNPLGRCVDVDEIDQVVGRYADMLAAQPWTALVDFRPTFEAMAKWLFGELESEIRYVTAVRLTDERPGCGTVVYRYRRVEGKS